MLTEAISRFSQERIRKVYRDAEEEGEIPDAVVQAGWEIGLLPTGLPEAYGGFGEYSAVTGVVAMEEFAWGDLAITLKLMVPNLVALPIMLAGTDAQKASFLPHFCDVTIPKMTAALTEPRIKYNPYRLETTAVSHDDHYILNGVKTVGHSPQSQK